MGSGAIVTAFAGSMFVSALLLFVVQPMFAKMALPLLGGAPGVWTVALVFFQAALLAGYAYAHALSRLKSLPLQAMIHAGVLALAGLSLPLALSSTAGSPTDETPVLWLLELLTLSLGAPFAALSATAPLLQSWYARTRQEDAGDPYHLYAASNLGSLISLIAYPTLIEPFSTLGQQTGLWSGGFVVAAGAILFCALIAARDDAGRPQAPAQAVRLPAFLALRERAIWIVLAAIPSSLLLGATTHITTDVASAPFLWAPPLILYLITFTIAFAKRQPLPWKTTSAIYSIIGLAIPPLILVAAINSATGIAVSLTALFFGALVCHQALAARRPHASRLTEFYFCMSLGGVLGGLFNAIAAPALFTSVIEFPIVLAIALAGLAPMGLKRSRGWIAAVIAIAAIPAALVIAMNLAGVEIQPTLVFGPVIACAVLAYSLRGTPVAFAAAGVLLSLAGVFFGAKPALFQDRSFFGVVRVTDDPANHIRTFQHGTTLHGSQSQTPGEERRPLAYYAAETPMGQVFKTLGRSGPIGTVGVVGLGAGALACYAQAGENWSFYEIDPLVARVARDPKLFTFLSNCTPGVPVRIGDARLTLAREPAATFDLLVLDAFSSDTVPSHLMTREAMALYLSKLKPGGLLVFHISNRYLELRDTLTRVAFAEGASVRFQSFKPTDAEAAHGVTRSKVLIIAPSEANFAPFDADPRWRKLAKPEGQPWTDDFSNVLGAMLAYDEKADD
jgi:SAM-dependent methyltransferase